MSDRTIGCIYFTRDGLCSQLMSLPCSEEKARVIGVQRTVLPRVPDFPKSDMAPPDNMPLIERREYRFTKYVEWFYGQHVMYFEEI